MIRDLQSNPSSQGEIEAGSVFLSNRGSCLSNVPRENSSSRFIFLPSDPNELVDRLELLYQEIIGGNDNPQLKQEIVAIVDKLLEYQCISTELDAALLTVGLFRRAP